MTRRLVLTSECSRHPLRRALPPAPPRKAMLDEDRDWKLFLLSFSAFFTCFYSFLA